MSDLLLVLMWLAVTGAGLGCAAGLARRGVPSAQVRDLLHVGAGVWVFGWHTWERPWVAVTIPWLAVVVLTGFPAVAVRNERARAVVDGITSEDELWRGVVFYALAFALLTTAALVDGGNPDAAAVALLALAWGDGLGGAVGSWLGRRTYRLPWTKPRSWVGSTVVAAATAAGAVAWSAWTGTDSTVWLVVGAGVAAALAEAVSPRGTDNVVVPAAVFGWLVAAG